MIDLVTIVRIRRIFAVFIAIKHTAIFVILLAEKRFAVAFNGVAVFQRKGAFLHHFEIDRVGFAFIIIINKATLFLRVTNHKVCQQIVFFHHVAPIVIANYQGQQDNNGKNKLVVMFDAH